MYSNTEVLKGKKGDELSGVWAAVLSCWYPEFLTTIYRAFIRRPTLHSGQLVYPTTGVLVHCAQGLCFCCFLKASPSLPAALQDLALSPPIRVKPLPLHTSSSFHIGACRRPLMLQWLQFYHQLSEKAFLERVYYVSSNKELYFHHRFSCPRLLALWLGVSSMRAIWCNG